MIDLAISNDVIEHGESSVPMETDEGSSDASFVILDSDEEDADLVSMDTESEEVNPINEELDEIKSKACLKGITHNFLFMCIHSHSMRQI